jgi:hypothetical protein
LLQVVALVALGLAVVVELEVCEAQSLLLVEVVH